MTKGSENSDNIELVVEESQQLQVCGIIMPISAIDGCAASHWADVLNILKDAISQVGFEPNLVSDADDVGVIQKRIIQNLYDNPIVVCDVSAKNANVMFELGMRLAFDKPTIVIKDDKTSYSFDTSPIEHLEYPRDLRFSDIVEFKKKLGVKISATLKKSIDDSNYTPFLKHFGEFKVAKLEQKEVSGQAYILDELSSIRASITQLNRTQKMLNHKNHRSNQESAKLATINFLRPLMNIHMDELVRRIKKIDYVTFINYGTTNSEKTYQMDIYGYYGLFSEKQISQEISGIFSYVGINDEDWEFGSMVEF